MALPTSASDEQGDARAERGGVAGGLCDRVEGTEAAASADCNRLIGRGKNWCEAVTAVARELAGFVWAIAREEKLLVS